MQHGRRQDGEFAIGDTAQAGAATLPVKPGNLADDQPMMRNANPCYPNQAALAILRALGLP